VNDAGNLQNLNDIVVPGPMAWWPLAPGWYVLGAIALTAFVVVAFRQWRRWQQNLYRRQAMLELSSIRERASAESFQQLPVLLKRAALSVWQRKEVAALTGLAWHRFLDESAGMDRFCSGAGDTLEALAYAGSDEALPADLELQQVLEAAEFWLKNHLRQAEAG
jgi:hypothetical protein